MAERGGSVSQQQESAFSFTAPPVKRGGQLPKGSFIWLRLSAAVLAGHMAPLRFGHCGEIACLCPLIAGGFAELLARAV
ncbi:hypothetical protein MHYP_G00180380 [Metynnis hypsauchen]